MAHRMLHFARMLGRGNDAHLIVLTRPGECDMAFQIEVVLAADPQRALQAARRGAKRGLYIPPLERQRLRYGIDRLVRVDNGRTLLIDDLGEAHGLPCFRPRPCNNREHGLAVE